MITGICLDLSTNTQLSDNLEKGFKNNVHVRGMSAKFVYMYRIKRNRRTSLKQITLGLSAI